MDNISKNSKPTEEEKEILKRASEICFRISDELWADAFYITDDNDELSDIFRKTGKNLEFVLSKVLCV